MAIYNISNICCAYRTIQHPRCRTIYAIISWQRLRQNFCVPQVVKGRVYTYMYYVYRVHSVCDTQRSHKIGPFHCVNRVVAKTCRYNI